MKGESSIPHYCARRLTSESIAYYKMLKVTFHAIQKFLTFY